jgi:hypothetical protein
MSTCALCNKVMYERSMLRCYECGAGCAHRNCLAKHQQLQLQCLSCRSAVTIVAKKADADKAVLVCKRAANNKLVRIAEEEKEEEEDHEAFVQELMKLCGVGHSSSDEKYLQIYA